MRGGQVTIFVVVGLVLLFTIGLFYAVISFSASPPPPDDGAETALLSTNVASCIDSVVAAELRQLGEQGGLTSFEGWPHATIDDGRNPRIVLVGITKNTDDLLPATVPNPPEYPETGLSFRTMEQDTRTGRELLWFQDGYFGDVNFPAICKKDGPNNVQSNIACRFYPGNPPNAPGPSVQELLEERVRQRVQACVSPTTFEQATGQDIRKVGEPSVEVTFTRSNTIVDFEYPLELPSGKTTRTFTREYGARFLPVMEFAIDLARADTRNVQFNVEEDLDTLPSYRGGFSVIRAEVPFSNAQGVTAPAMDLITIIDSESVLDGTSFMFSFLAEHRGPMLDHVQQQDWLDMFDGLPVTIEGADPDDGKVTILYCLYAHPDCAGGPVPRIEVIDPDGERDWQVP